jgi:hypothetical protein
VLKHVSRYHEVGLEQVDLPAAVHLALHELGLGNASRAERITVYLHQLFDGPSPKAASPQTAPKLPIRFAPNIGREDLRFQFLKADMADSA